MKKKAKKKVLRKAKKKIVRKKARPSNKVNWSKTGRTLVLKIINDKKKSISEVTMNSLDFKTSRTLSGMYLGLTNKKTIVFPTFQKDEGYGTEIQLCEISGEVIFIFDLGSPIRATTGIQPQLLPKALTLRVM
jgi:hypothetical protein